MEIALLPLEDGHALVAEVGVFAIGKDAEAAQALGKRLYAHLGLPVVPLVVGGPRRGYHRGVLHLGSLEEHLPHLPRVLTPEEIATFYLSFASVVLGSTWALWGSLVGAGVVFWGNLTSMGLGLKGRLGAERRERAVSLQADLSRTSREGVFRPQTGNGEEREAPKPQPPVPTPPWNGTDPVRAPWNGKGTDAVPTPPPGEREAGTPWVREAPPVNGEAGAEEEGELSRLLEALSSPKGPSALARELSWPKSTVARRLKRLVEMGLVQSDGGVYRRAEAASA